MARRAARAGGAPTSGASGRTPSGHRDRGRGRRAPRPAHRRPCRRARRRGLRPARRPGRPRSRARGGCRRARGGRRGALGRLGQGARPSGLGRRRGAAGPRPYARRRGLPVSPLDGGRGAFWPRRLPARRGRRPGRLRRPAFELGAASAAGSEARAERRGRPWRRRGAQGAVQPVLGLLHAGVAGAGGGFGFGQLVGGGGGPGRRRRRPRWPAARPRPRRRRAARPRRPSARPPVRAVRSGAAAISSSSAWASAVELAEGRFGVLADLGLAGGVGVDPARSASIQATSASAWAASRSMRSRSIISPLQQRLGDGASSRRGFSASLGLQRRGFRRRRPRASVSSTAAVGLGPLGLGAGRSAELRLGSSGHSTAMPAASGSRPTAGVGLGLARLALSAASVVSSSRATSSSRARLASAAFSRRSASCRRPCRPETPAASSSTRRRLDGLAAISSEIWPWRTRAGELAPVEASANSSWMSRARVSTAVDPIGRALAAVDPAGDLQHRMVVERGRAPCAGHCRWSAGPRRGSAAVGPRPRRRSRRPSPRPAWPWPRRPHHPAQGFQQVGLAAAVRADHAGQARFDPELGRIDEGLEARKAQPLEAQGGPPRPRLLQHRLDHRVELGEGLLAFELGAVDDEGRGGVDLFDLGGLLRAGRSGRSAPSRRRCRR